MRTKVYIPLGKPPGSYGNSHLDDCLGAPCPTGYLAAGYVEMNQDLKAAHEQIAQLREEAKEAVKLQPARRLTVEETCARAIEARRRRESKP